MLFQAGASTRGREFAAKHAECVFIAGLTREATATAAPPEYGRDPASLIIYNATATIADAMESWMDETGIDGFNLIHSVAPADYTDVVDFVVPELQSRGRTAYPQGDTLREKIYGPGQAWLQPDHPGAGYRKSTAN